MLTTSTSTTDVELRPLRPSDEDAWLSARAAATGSAPSRAAWRWGLVASPEGHHAWLAEREGRVLAGYATRRQRVVADGEERCFGLVVDAFARREPGVDADALFAETARRLLDEAYGPDRDLAAYGWTSGPAWPLAHDALGFELLRMECVLSRPTGDGPAELPLRRGELEVADADPAGLGDDARALYDAARAPWGVSFVRDAAWLAWRLGARPGGGYRLLAARDRAGALRGWAAVRRVIASGAPALALVDWLVPDADQDAGRALVDAVLAEARRAGAASVLAILPAWSPWFERLQAAGFLAGGSDLLLALRKTHPRHEIYWMRESWWYQPADLDLA